MFSLMLDPRFVLSSLIGCEQGKAIVEKYDKNLFFNDFKMLLSLASIG